MEEAERKSLYVITNNDDDPHCLQMFDDTCSGESWLMPFHRRASEYSIYVDVSISKRHEKTNPCCQICVGIYLHTRTEAHGNRSNS